MNAFELKTLAGLVLQKLIIERKKENITPMQPIHGEDLIKQYNAKFQTSFTVPELREAISELRCQGEPIGSVNGSDGGYFYCVSEFEWSETRKRLLDRIKHQQKAADAPTLRFLANQNTLLEHPAVKELEKQFGAVEVKP